MVLAFTDIWKNGVKETYEKDRDYMSIKDVVSVPILVTSWAVSKDKNMKGEDCEMAEVRFTLPDDDESRPHRFKTQSARLVDVFKAMDKALTAEQKAAVAKEGMAMIVTSKHNNRGGETYSIDGTD